LMKFKAFTFVYIERKISIALIHINNLEYDITYKTTTETGKYNRETLKTISGRCRYSTIGGDGYSAARVTSLFVTRVNVFEDFVKTAS
jgi:hypothetical protein